MEQGINIPCCAHDRSPKQAAELRIGGNISTSLAHSEQTIILAGSGPKRHGCVGSTLPILCEVIPERFAKTRHPVSLSGPTTISQSCPTAPLGRSWLLAVTAPHYNGPPAEILLPASLDADDTILGDFRTVLRDLILNLNSGILS